MEDNPYSRFVGLLKQESNRITKYQATMHRGEVVKTSPLTIRTAGIDITGNELMVNTNMLKHAASVSMTEILGILTATVDCAQGAINNISISDGNITTSAELIPDLSVGDNVLLLTNDGQLFYVLCKVVNV